MECKITIDQKYLAIPIQAEEPEEMLEIFRGSEKLYEFQVPVFKDPEKVRYYSYLNVEQYQGRELTLKGGFAPAFFEHICQSAGCEREPLERPLLHFTADRGWINDPNGLVYQDGVYHLYFQYNPMNTQWQNMSWGHSVSRDLLHFQQVDTVMYPDEHGTIFSGCSIVNEHGLLDLPQDALLFCYSAAGGNSKWSEGKFFEQRIAYSVDGGKSLVKMDEPAIGVIERDTRDPKVFWHEESKAYIMVLWIKDNVFGIFRSQNLQEWEETDRLDLPDGWECPDLFCLDCEGEKVWVFTSADGYYWSGKFDGYRFTCESGRKKVYTGRLAYAAQTYSGVQGRIISVPWLRTLNVGHLYTGMMGIPRELGLVKRGEEKLLTMVPVREYEAQKQQACTFTWGEDPYETEIREDVVTEIELNLQESGELTVEFFGQELQFAEDLLIFRGEKMEFPEKPEKIRVIIDREVAEIFVNDGIGNACLETGESKLTGTIRIKGGAGCGKIWSCR